MVKFQISSHEIMKDRPVGRVFTDNLDLKAIAMLLSPDVRRSFAPISLRFVRTPFGRPYEKSSNDAGNRTFSVSRSRQWRPYRAVDLPAISAEQRSVYRGQSKAAAGRRDRGPLTSTRTDIRQDSVQAGSRQTRLPVRSEGQFRAWHRNRCSIFPVPNVQDNNKRRVKRSG
jgi:hypothetical protein